MGSLKQGYENICRILSGNRKRFSIHSPNLFDIEFFDMMSQEFWLPQSNNLIIYGLNINYLYLNIYYLYYFRLHPTCLCMPTSR